MKEWNEDEFKESKEYKESLEGQTVELKKVIKSFVVDVKENINKLLKLGRNKK